MSNELQVWSGGTFAVTTASDAVAALESAFDSGVGVFDLTRVRVPAGGATTWGVPGLAGDEPLPAIECVVAVVQARQRAWWRQTMEEGGGSQPPSCVSTDGLTGIGDNTLEGAGKAGDAHDCATCAWGQFGSSRKGGRGKDCKEFARLFVFRRESHMPTVVTVPPTSLKPMREYLMRLAERRLAPCSVVTRLKLDREKADGGITYSKIRFEFGGVLPEQEAAQMVDLARRLRERVATRTVEIEATEVGG